MDEQRAVTLVSVSASAAPALAIGEAAVVPSHASENLDVRPLDLAAVRRLFFTLARERATMTEGERVAAWADFSLVADAVIGDSRFGPITFDELTRSASGAQAPHVRATPGVTMRDATAYQLLSAWLLGARDGRCRERAYHASSPRHSAADDRGGAGTRRGSRLSRW